MNYNNGAATTVQRLTDDEFVHEFESCRLPNESFRHRDHLRLAWIYLLRFGRREAAGQIARSIRRYAAHHGKSDKYHETVTVAWLRLVDDAAARSLAPASFDDLVAASPELLDKNILQEYYSPEALASETARMGFIPPDRKPLPGGSD